MVTWHALGAGALLLIGIVVACFGVLEIFAGGMSDAPSAGEEMGKRGCVVTLLGVTAVAGAVVMMFRP